MEEARIGLDLPTGPKQPHSTELSLEEEAAIVAFRRHTLLCLMIVSMRCSRLAHLTRTSLHLCLQRHPGLVLPGLPLRHRSRRSRHLLALTSNETGAWSAASALQPFNFMASEVACSCWRSGQVKVHKQETATLP